MPNQQSETMALLSKVELEEPASGLRQKLAEAQAEQRPLNIKLGVDPTAPDLHLGHAIVLQKLAEFQRAGHDITLIIGDFTAKIGDPTGRNKTRPPLTDQQIEANTQTYLDQLSKVLDLTKTRVRRNSEWLDKMTAAGLLQLLGNATLAQLLQREDFKTRFGANQPISLHEMVYPLLQAYDSVVIDADIEIGGTDQLFNNLMGRTLQRALGKRAQIVLCLPLLVGTDGVEKMSKSKNNAVGLIEEPAQIFGKIMSMPDSCLADYVRLVCDWPDARGEAVLDAMEQPNFDAMKLKLDVAETVVARFHTPSDGERAREHFRKNYQNKEEADHELVPISSLPKEARLSLINLVTHFERTFSKSHVRRLVAQGGIRVNGQPVQSADAPFEITEGMTLKIGKHKYYRLS